jgi:hypothetical protein
VEFYLEADDSVPGLNFLDSCPIKGRLEAIVEAVRAYPPPSFPPSPMWNVMTGEMKGIYETRARNQNRLHRLFCLLDRLAGSHGLSGPALVILSGGEKPVGAAMPNDVYASAMAQRDRYLDSTPRPVMS